MSDGQPPKTLVEHALYVVVMLFLCTIFAVVFIVWPIGWMFESRLVRMAMILAASLGFIWLIVVPMFDGTFADAMHEYQANKAAYRECLKTQSEMRCMDTVKAH